MLQMKLLTFIGLQLYRNSVLLHCALNHPGVVHDHCLDIEGGTSRFGTLVAQQDGQLGVRAQMWAFSIHRDLQGHVFGERGGIHLWLGTVMAGSLNGDALFVRA